MINIKDAISNIEGLKKALKSRGADDSVAYEIAELDSARRELIGKVEDKKAIRNKTSKSIGQMIASGEDATIIKQEMKTLGIEISELDSQLAEIEEKLTEISIRIPNYPLPDVPVGTSEEENVVIKTVMEPRKFDFTPKPHWDIGKELDTIDSERAAKLSGSRFIVLKGDAAKLQRALISFMLDRHTKQNGFTEVFAPSIVTENTAFGTGQLPKFKDDMYKIEGEDQYLISTNEITLVNMHSDEIIPASSLPIKYTGYAFCFRKEAGSAGRDTKGLIRVHQFEKVEMVTLCHPEKSNKELENLVEYASDILTSLELPHRISLMCTGDMSGFSAAKSYDLEVWMPSYDKYVEVSSCSNCTDFQARRAKIRFKTEQGEKSQFVHTLNGSGLAIGRTIAAILENHQNNDGSVRIPKALVPYMGQSTIEGNTI